jgi:dipeptidyl-peptidase-4
MKKIYTIIFVALAFALPTLAQNKKFTLEQIWGSGELSAKAVSGFQSMKDGEHYTRVEFDSATKQNFLYKYNYKTGKKQGIVLEESQLKPAGTEKPLGMDGYQFSPDETKIMVMSEYEQIYRHSFKARYAIYDKAKKKCEYISDKKGMYPTFSPDGKKIAWVRDNNLYIIDLETGTETAVTTDGRKNEIINGAVDWVYEEEFSMDKGFEWNVDGTKLAYYRFDERKVKEFGMPIYGSLYPTYETFKYPKAGEGNSDVEVYIYSMNDKKITKVDVGAEKDQYIPRIHWTMDAQKLSFLRLNRLQNKLELIMTQAESGKSTTIITEEADTYLDIFDDITFLNDGKFFLWSSEKSGYKHIYLYGIDGKEINAVTSGKWEVSDFMGVDEAKSTVFYTSLETSQIDRNLYSVKLDGSKKERLTVRQGVNNIQFSKNWNYFLCTNSNINSPYYVSIHDRNGKELRMLENNAALKKKLEGYEMSEAKFFEMNTSELINLKGFMITPKVFDINKKHPVLMYVYGGPGSQQVLDQWKGGYYYWFQYLAQQGYIVVCVDNRGTGGRGEVFKKITYKELGYYEIIDQIEVAKWLGEQSFVDKSRIGMFGWSFGGYMSSLAITKGADQFKAAIAVAPVTNWRYYDNIYTERYMQLPSMNAKGYDDNSPINHVSKIKGNFLMIHGTADDNVHFQNSVEMADAMIKNNVKFDSEFYPNKNHGISGGKTRLHLFLKMTDWLMKNL